MSMRLPGRFSSRSLLAAVLLLAVMAAIFVFDTVTDYAIAAAVFYTAVILVSARLLTVWTVVLLAGACIGLTVVSFGFTRSGAYEVGMINTAISVIAIGVTTYLVLKLVAAETAAHEARERLLRISRMTTLGQLTTSIAHEVSQPLAAISTNASACRRWLARTPPDMAKAQEAVDRIVDNIDRARDVLSRVRRLARGEEAQKSPFGFNDAVLEIVALSRHEINRHAIVLDIDLEEGLPPVLADRVQIQQVIGNLILNAIEAMAEETKERRLVLSSSHAPSNKINFTVADTGAGLSASAREHLFDAFWTSKKDGFGLGLTICRSIVEASGGQIVVSSGPEGGAVFRFDLPTIGREQT